MPRNASAMTGNIGFVGTDHVGIKLNSLTTAQYTALTEANGDIYYDMTLNRIAAWINGGHETLAILGANTFSGAQIFQSTITNTIAGNSTFVTGASAINIFAAASAAEKVNITKDGVFSSISASFFNVNTAGGGFAWSGNGRGLGVNGARLLSTDVFGWQSGTGLEEIDTTLYRGAANTIYQRNGANAQTIWLAGSYTDVSNYSRYSLAATPTELTIAAQGAGTGVAGGLANKNIVLSPLGTGAVQITPITAGSDSSFRVNHTDGTKRCLIGTLPGLPNNAAIWLANITTPSDTNYALMGTANYTSFNGPTGGTLYFQVGNFEFAAMTANLLSFSAGKNVALDTVTGSKFGTATNQKMAWWNATPVVQQVLATGGGATVDNVISLLQTLGLCRQTA